MTAREHPYLRTLHRALVADAHHDVQLALRVGVLLSAGYPRARIARMLGVEARDMALPLERLERVAKSLNRDDEL
jgi:hypothetical protein